VGFVQHTATHLKEEHGLQKEDFIDEIIKIKKKKKGVRT